MFCVEIKSGPSLAISLLGLEIKKKRNFNCFQPIVSVTSLSSMFVGPPTVFFSKGATTLETSHVVILTKSLAIFTSPCHEILTWSSTLYVINYLFSREVLKENIPYSLKTMFNDILCVSEFLNSCIIIKVSRSEMKLARKLAVTTNSM